ncbi:alanine racemase [candidate division LCP-89 bacterium B3_LCP]|uniref:Alanine racemase n=1 Tax=candidate division LCP-89 bacterium B3_LCP TaxID=2012998 RepID=A0A532URK4_UNCL8|nr:MAG: alanine racemase [candidate division LCP-89 bacterium B3_LCP]
MSNINTSESAIHRDSVASIYLQGKMRRRPTHAVIDLGALRSNYQFLHKLAGERPIMAVVKANAYGHGLEETARVLVKEGVAYFGVGFLEEGIALRRAGIRTPILVLGGAVGYQAALFLEYDLDLTISSIALARQVAQEVRNKGHSANVHLKIDTGMNRIGVSWQNAMPFIKEALSLEELNVVGIYSHLATSDESDTSYTKEQLQHFRKVLVELEELQRPIPRIHIANSGGLFFHEESLFNLVRLGISLYGCQPSDELDPPEGLTPVMSLVSEVVFVKRVPEGTPVSYGCTWKAPRETTIATVPIGYGDGYPRALSNKGQVLIRGERMPVVGTVCMDQLMVDCGETRVEVGDPVALIGAQGEDRISAEEVASWLDTISYEVTTQVNTRVPRVFVRG